MLLATLATLIPYAFSAAAQLLLLATDRAAFSGRGRGEQPVFYGYLLLLAGIPVYVWIRWRDGQPPRPEQLPRAERRVPVAMR